MKIGIVTFHRVPNYGALLQAFALSSWLEQRGHEVYIVTDGFGCARRFSWKSIVRSRGLSAIRNKLQHNSDMAIVDEFCQRFSEVSCNDLRGAAAELLDVFIVGSDQVWNPDWCLPFLSDVFLDFPNRHALRLAYAASFGQRAWTGCEAETAGRLLAGFDAISVREESGVGIVRTLARREANWLPDPTLLFDADFYANLAASYYQQEAEPYLFSFIRYGKGNETRSLEQQIMRANKLDRVVTDRAPAPRKALARLAGISKRLTVGGWLGGIQNSQYVITNSFHAVVFSILHRRPFLAVSVKGAAEGMNVRLESLLTRLGLEARLCSPDGEAGADVRIDEQIDWDKVHERIRLWRREADHFIAAQGL